MLDHDFVVKVLTGTPAELARCAVEWGYDGIEFMPDPERVPDPDDFEEALREAGAMMPVVNTGRMSAQGMALLHEDPNLRRRSVEAFKNILDFAGHLGARVGLGVARGQGIPENGVDDLDQIAEETFRELAEHAQKARTTIMLEPADPGATHYINTVEEAVGWAERIGSPHFSVMLDTYQLMEVEPSIEHGIEIARGLANHIHLYDPSRWPPGVLPEGQGLDWPRIVRALRRVGFEGSGSVVLAPEGDPEPAARRAIAYLRRLFDDGND